MLYRTVEKRNTQIQNDISELCRKINSMSTEELITCSQNIDKKKYEAQLQAYIKGLNVCDVEIYLLKSNEFYIGCQIVYHKNIYTFGI